MQYAYLSVSIKNPSLVSQFSFFRTTLGFNTKKVFGKKKNPTISKNHFSTLIFRRPHLMLFNKLPVAPVRGQLL